MIRRRKPGQKPVKTYKSRKKPGSIVEHIQAISDAANEIGLLEGLLLKKHASIGVVAEYLKCSDEQAAIFSVIFTLNFVRSSVDLEDIANFLKCNPLNIAARIPDFDALITLRLIRKEPPDGILHRQLFPQSLKYHILPELFEPILLGKELTRSESRFDNSFGLLKEIGEIMINRENGVYTYPDMEREIQFSLHENEHLPLVGQIKALDLSKPSFYMLLFISGKFIQNEESVQLPDMLKCIFPGLAMQIGIRKMLVQGQHELQKKELVSLEEHIFKSDRYVALTEKCVDLLFAEDKNLITGKEEARKPGIINCRDIPEKHLFFTDSEQKSLGFLENVMQPDNFKRLTMRLEEKKMPKGVAILLYGAPGTGKTESVYQLARRTGRDIHQVVISETKSKWFGESEKLIKQIFDKYRSLVELKEVAPILLFNEADGIFGRRKESNQSAVDQTENAIQNIILQELEDLNGILIATTNMANNLDTAFERRFLYKIRFEKPTVESRIHIWKDKIPSLTPEETACLAEKFNLSGGQIDNIARKCIMKEVLHGTLPELAELIDFCNEENVLPVVGRIGFR